MGEKTNCKLPTNFVHEFTSMGQKIYPNLWKETAENPAKYPVTKVEPINNTYSIFLIDESKKERDKNTENPWQKGTK